MLETIGLILLALGAIFWFPYRLRTTRKGAPFLPTEPKVVERVMKLANLKKGEVFYDLGSDDGRLVITAALYGAKAYGVEIDCLHVLYSRVWIKLLRLFQKAQIIRQDFFKTDLSKANVVSLYLLEETNQKLKEKIKEELREGTRVISSGFIIPGWRPTRINFKGPIYGPIYLYEIGKK